MPQYNETADDLNKKYGHSFGFLRGELVFFGEFRQKENGCYAYVTFDEKQPLAPKEVESSKDIEAAFIDEKFVNNTTWKSDADEPEVPLVHFRRSPKRQWKRGLCKENVYITCPYGKVVSSLTKKPFNTMKTALNLSLIRHLLAPVYPTWRDAFPLVDRYQAVAVSPMFAIMLSSISQDRYLLTNTFGLVGEVTPTHICVKHAPAFQEIRDFVTRNKLSIAIEVDV